MVTDQNHSSNAGSQGDQVIRRTEKLAQIYEPDKQNVEVYSVLSGKNRELKKQLEDYHSQHNTLEKKVKRLERDVGSLKIELENLNECVNRETVVNLIHEIAFLPNINKCKGSSYSFETSEKSDSVEIIEVRDEKAVPYKQ